MKYIIEHLEPELDEWSRLEYLHISTQVSPENLIISGIAPSLLSQLPSEILASGQLTTQSILDLCSQSTFDLQFDKILLLDPASPTELTPSDAQHFNGLLFGGILGKFKKVFKKTCKIFL